MLLNSLMTRLGRRSAPTERTTHFRPTLESLGEKALPSSTLPNVPFVGPIQVMVGSQGHDVPFRLRGDGQVMSNPFDPAGAPFQASGQASLLGAWTNTGTLIVDSATGSAHGNAVFTAANSDLLAMNFTGQIDANGHATATFIVDAATSTGRF